MNVDDFCKLYILLKLGEFLVPNVEGTIFSWFIYYCR